MVLKGDSRIIVLPSLTREERSRDTAQMTLLAELELPFWSESSGVEDRGIRGTCSDPTTFIAGIHMGSTVSMTTATSDPMGERLEGVIVSLSVHCA